MNNPSFISLMFSQFLDTWIVSEESEVDALVDYLYEQLIGYELKNNSRKTKDTLKIVLLNLYSTYISDPRLFLRYSRDETFYSNWIRRYVGASLKYQSLVTKVIPALLRLKLIEDHKGFHDRREFGRAFQSRMSAKPKLIKLFDQYGLQPWMLSISSEKEIIILKDNDKKFLPYKDTDFTKDAREQLQHINRHLEAAVIDLNLNEEQMRGLLRRMRKSDDGDFDDQGKHLSFFTQKTLYRIFSNSSWKQHGRFYGGWWMQLPEREKVKENGKSTTNPLRFRDEIVINNEITVELDFSSFHPKMIYDLEGLEMEGDPYVGIGDLDRDHGKSIFNMMVNSLDENKAIGAYMKEYRDEGITKAKAREAVNSVLERHHSIHRKFFSGLGLKLMNYDSQIANDVMLRAINEFRTVVLPVHDSFICITEFKDQLRELMSDSYTEVMKPEVPVGIDRKYSEYYISDEEEFYQDEYGIQYEYEIPPDPGQTQRKEALEKQASAARLKYGIWFENAFTPEHLSDKYAPQEPDR